MNYLILHQNEAFYTNWFDYENNYMPEMVVFDLLSDTYTLDGITWIPIQEDHL